MNNRRKAASARGGCVEFKSTLPEKGDTRKGKVVNELKNKAKANTVEESRYLVP